jgi:hypothetical protein
MDGKLRKVALCLAGTQRGDAGGFALDGADGGVTEQEVA